MAVWTKVPTVTMLNVEQVPVEIREIAILRGYRKPTCSPLECLASVFSATNETFNFWTHFIPTWYFVWKLIELTDTLDFWSDTYTWAFLCYMLTSCLYPLTSCVAHAFSSMSNEARHICYFIDYGALGLYSYGSAVLYRAYCLPDYILSVGFGDVYLLVNMLGSAVCVVMACSSRFVTTHWAEKSLRLGAFALPYFWSGIPLCYRVVTCASQRDACLMPSFEYHIRQFAVAMAGAFLYASHVPERFAPGCFDIVGHSHQLLHICGILATREQMTAALLDLQYRRHHINVNDWTLLPLWSYGSMIVIFTWTILVISVYSHRVVQENKKYS